MDQQGAGRTRSAADTRRQPPWSPLEGASEPVFPQSTSFPESTSSPESTGPLPARSPGYGARSGPQRVLDPATGPGRLIGSGSIGSGSIGSGSIGSGSIGSGSAAQPVLGPGSGPHRVLGPGTGPGRLIGSGSGANPVLRSGSGAQPVLDPAGPAGPAGTIPRTPARGFPSGRGPAEPPAGSASPWHTPREPLADPDDTYLAPLDAVSPPGRRRGGRPRRPLRSRVAWLATAVVVVAGAGFAGYKFLYEPRVNAPVPPTLRLPTSAPGSPGFDKTLGKWQHIGSRAEDPQSLTIIGLYPPQFALGGKSYVRTAASVTKTCSLAVYGADLQAALQSGHCSQVLRASYISGDGKMMGTVGVVNLISSNAAQQAGKVTGPQEIIAPLTSKKGPTSKLGNGTGVVQAEIKGHYMILMWAEFTSLKSPSGSAQRQALEQFAANLVTGSANINLSTRMLTGKS